MQTVGVVQEPFYFYIQRSGSISKSTDPRIFHCVENWNGVLDYYKKQGYFEEYYKELEYCYVRYMYATFLKASLKYDKQTYQTAMSTAMGEVRKHYRHYRRNSYFYHSMKGLYCVLFNKVIGELLYAVKGKKQEDY